MDFPLFSGRPPQKVAIRSPSPSPPPVAPVGRIVDEEDEDPDVLALRRAQIESVTIDAQDILANAKVTRVSLLFLDRFLPFSKRNIISIHRNGIPDLLHIQYAVTKVLESSLIWLFYPL